MAALAAGAGVGAAYGQDTDGPNKPETVPVRFGSEHNPMPVSGGVMAGQVLQKVKPVYPEAARDEKVWGSVVMAATIDTTGKVVQLAAVAGPEALREAALTAVRRWTYSPYYLNGNAVFVKTTVTVSFNLNDTP